MVENSSKSLSLAALRVIDSVDKRNIELRPSFMLEATLKAAQLRVAAIAVSTTDIIPNCTIIDKKFDEFNMFWIQTSGRK